MNFHSPHLLWLLVPLLLLFSWELARRAGAGATVFPKVRRAWAGAFNVTLGAQHSTVESRPRIWLWFGLALCVIGLARPQWGVIEERVFDQSREVLIALDLSRSMLADDVKPNRLERSKLLITSLLDRLRGERVGLVLFAGTSFLQVPLSADYEILREFLPALRPEYLPEGGSNYKAMLETAMQAFGTSTADRYLIILSDGESTEDGWRELGDALKNKGIRIIGLGIGTVQGAFLPDGSGGFIKDERGAVVLSRLDSSTLQELAQRTGGAYTDASTWVDLPGLLRRTVEAGQKGEFSEQNTVRRVERFQWFLAPGLLLLLISFWAEFPVRPRERALPLGGGARRNGPPAAPAAARVAAVLGLFSLAGLASPPNASAQDDALAKPLTTTVARLVSKPSVTAKEFAELAQATVTYGQRLKDSPQKAPQGVIRDGLAAVDAGETADPKAADWRRLREELEALLEQPEPPPEEQQKQDEQQQQNQQQQNQSQQNQSQDQEQNSQQQQPQQQDSESQDQQNKPPQPDAFGDMKEQEQSPTEEKEPPRPPEPQTQKVGGQKEKKEMPVDPELAMPLQKLEQVRNQDSPARLHMLMEGQQQKTGKKGKDW